MLEKMDTSGVDKAVILPIACKRARSVDIWTNAQIAELVKMSGRFIGSAILQKFSAQKVLVLASVFAFIY